MKKSREDGSNEVLARFGKDRRTSTAPSKPKERSASTASPRRSFNPNFSSDNKLMGRKDSRNSSPGSFASKDQRSPNYNDSRPQGGENSSEKGRPFERRGSSFDKGRSFDKGGKSFDKGRPFERGGKSFDKGRSFDKGDGFDKKRSFTPKPTFEKRDRMPKSDDMRLNRFIANSGVCSRREADEFIKAGVITVNGVVVTELGVKVKPSDEIRFNDETLKGEQKVYILMNKPKGFVTTVEDPHADKTVIDIVKNSCPQRVYPVGRLDKNSLGVLLLTNDGELTRQLTHPSYNKKKIYQVTLDKPLTKAHLDQIAKGVTLEDGEIIVDDIAWVDASKKEVGVEIHSGRNRVVRRIFESLGYKISKLDRVFFAGLTKKNLKRGAWRFLTPAEVSMLKADSYQ